MHCLCCGEPLRVNEKLYCEDCRAEIDAEAAELVAKKEMAVMRRGA